MQLKPESGKNILDDIRQHLADGWQIKYASGDFYLLTKNAASFRTLLILTLLLGWWTFFIPNIIYLVLTYKKKKISKSF